MRFVQYGALGVLSLFGLGYLLGSSRAHAAPSDVIGSANVAVDTYRNSRGSFVLWADGRITDAATGAVKNDGLAYEEPAGARPAFTAPTLDSGAGLGSSRVAVKAVSRGDGSYVLFSDGRFRRPKDPTVAAATDQSRAVAFGSSVVPLGSAASFSYNPDEIVSVTHQGGGINYLITFAQPVDHVQLHGYVSYSNSSGHGLWGLGITKLDDTHFRLHSDLSGGGSVYSCGGVIVAY